MELPEIPLWRLFLFLDRQLLQYAMKRELAKLEADPGEAGLMLFEGEFNLVKTAMVFARAGEDVAVIDFHMAPIRAGLIADTAADNAEMDLIKARVATLWNALNGYYGSEFSYDRLVFHDAGPKITDELGRARGLARDSNGKALPGQSPANPALRTDLTGLAGDSAAAKMLPPQVAVTVTFKTVARRQWGRVYLPALDVNALSDGLDFSAGGGQLGASHAADIRTAFGTFADGLQTDNVPLVVWSTKHQHALTVDQVQVDSLFDVQRSRRFDHAATFSTHTVGA